MTQLKTDTWCSRTDSMITAEDDHKVLAEALTLGLVLRYRDGFELRNELGNIGIPLYVPNFAEIP